MATRNRTAVFLRAREGRIALSPKPVTGKDDKQYNLLEGGPASDEPDAPWVQDAEKCRLRLAEVKKQIANLGAAQQRALRNIVSTDNAEEHEVEVLSGQVARSFAEIQQLIKQINSAPLREGKNSAHASLRLNVVRQLATDVSEHSRSFRRMQQDYMARIRSLDDGAPAGLGGLMSAAGPRDEGLATGVGQAVIHDLDDISSFPAPRDTGFTDAQVLMTEHHEALIQERDQQIRQIQRSVEDLATLMKDLMTLVIDQGTILDRIDFNVVQVRENVEKGLKELQKADKSQASVRYKLCIILLIVLIVLLGSILFARQIMKK